MQNFLPFIKKHPRLYSFMVVGIVFLFYIYGLPSLLESFKDSQSVVMVIFYLIGYIYFLIATVFLAKAKGRSKVWGILGFLGLVIIDSLNNLN